LEGKSRKEGMLPMEPMTFWQLVENNPEWVGVFANTLFAIVTIIVIVWQVLVVRKQGRDSARREEIQNRLLRLQHEHEWVLRKNQEREQLLKLARDLDLAAGCLEEKSSVGDSISWQRLQDTAYELDKRLSILDVATYSGAYDQWFFSLKDYVDAVLQVMRDDESFDRKYDVAGDTPNLTSRKALKEVAKRCEPVKIFLDLEAAIRMESFEFKQKWDAELDHSRTEGNQ
jgi:hypothetical protein